MANVLTVDDDLQLCNSLNEWLEAESHQVTTCHSGFAGKEKLASEKFDLVILDLGLPDIDGVEVCKWFRDKGGITPVVMLTGRTDLQEKENGLDSGADDYLTKPFDKRELLARVRALLRRPQTILANEIEVGDLRLDARSRTVRKAGMLLDLSNNEFALLEFLMRNANRVFDAKSILNHVWTAQSDVAPEAVRTTMKRLRKQIDDPDKPSRIENIYGVGYKLVDYPE
ncbi:MAG TPA: response regulator transcription factor [Chroococcales cyanobacterium]